MRHERSAQPGRRLNLEVLEPRLTLSGSGLTAQYFHNIDFIGLAETRTENVAHRWALGSPAPGIDVDTFSVRWTGQIEPEFTQAYRFHLSSDEGVRVWIDGNLVIDAWTAPARALQSSAILLTAGERYDIRVDFFENSGPALIELSWSSASQPLELIPADRLYESPAGLLGTYTDTTGSSLSRIDPAVDFYWGTRGPAAGFAAEQFSIHWTGQLRADFSEGYTFSTISDERVRMWIGNELVIDHWNDHATTEDLGTKWLEAGKWYDVRLEYFDVQGHAELHWRWSSAGQTGGVFEVVPTENLRAAERPLITFKNPLGKGADPFVLQHDGYYYLTMTSGSSVSIHRARALEDIHPDSPQSDSVLAWDPPPGTPYSHDVWAPEIHRLDGKWYIYVAASDGANETHRMHVLERNAPDPFGPFVYKGQIAVPTDRWAIDGTVLEWEGALYFIWSGWPGTTNTSQNLYIAPMSNPWTLSGDRVLLSTPQFAWERHGLPINEGPQILIHDGQLHIIYSGSGFWRHEYALGRLTYNGTGPLLNRNSWIKSATPVFQRTAEVVGTGHASFTKSPGGDEHWIVYHAHGSPTDPARDVRIQPFTYFADGTPNFGAPIVPTQAILIPSDGPDPERPALTGDYNADGMVDSADYDTWKATFGAPVFPGSAADGNGNGLIDSADYSIWRDNLGAQAPAIAAATGGSAAATTASQAVSVEISSQNIETADHHQLLPELVSPLVWRETEIRPSVRRDRLTSHPPAPPTARGSALALMQAAFAEWRRADREVEEVLIRGSEFDAASHAMDGDDARYSMLGVGLWRTFSASSSSSVSGSDDRCHAS